MARERSPDGGHNAAAMAVLSLTNAHLAYGHVPLLEGTGFSLDAGERLGLIGRNGAGKSSLLKIAAGLEKPDDGLLQVTQGLRIRYVPQKPVFDDAATVFDAVADGVAEARAGRAAGAHRCAGSRAEGDRPAPGRRRAVHVRAARRRRAAGPLRAHRRRADRRARALANAGRALKVRRRAGRRAAKDEGRG